MTTDPNTLPVGTTIVVRHNDGTWARMFHQPDGRWACAHGPDAATHRLAPDEVWRHTPEHDALERLEAVRAVRDGLGTASDPALRIALEWIGDDLDAALTGTPRDLAPTRDDDTLEAPTPPSAVETVRGRIDNLHNIADQYDHQGGSRRLAQRARDKAEGMATALRLLAPQAPQEPQRDTSGWTINGRPLEVRHGRLVEPDKVTCAHGRPVGYGLPCVGCTAALHPDPGPTPAERLAEIDRITNSVENTPGGLRESRALGMVEDTRRG